MVKVYTRTGDDGTTHCYKAGRVSKSDILIDAIGTVDELNSHTGLLVAEIDAGRFAEEMVLLRDIQNRLFDVGGALATIPVQAKFAELIERIKEKSLETRIDWMEKVLDPIQQFILPGGSLGASQAHICRSVCRRAEREVVRLTQSIESEAEVVAGLAPIVRYLNRLSDFFFVLARYINKQEENEDIFWSQE